MELSIDISELRKRKVFIATPMYGGQCSGQFTKSCVDLSALAKAYELDYRFFYLFNESLITRARNYLADEFLRSDCTHLMFIDSDIGFDPNDVLALAALASPDTDKDIVCGPYPKKCLHHSAKVLTEEGFKPISWVVKNKYSGNVVSFDSNGNKVFSKVINHWSEPNKNKKWLSIRTSSVRSRDLLTVTTDHEVAVVEDVLNPSIKFIEAKDLLGKHLVVNPTKNSNRKFNALYNKHQLSALIGVALGDGCLSNGSFGCNHGPKQKDYLQHKAKLFNANVSKNGLRFSIKNGQTVELSKLIGKSSTKTVKNIVSNLDEISFAYMYMDDGHLYDYAVRSEDNEKNNWWFNLDTGESKRGVKPENGNWILGRKETLRKPTSSIATMCYSVEDNQLLVDVLKNKFGIESYIRFQSPNKYGQKYPFIVFDSENTEKFHKLIKAYIHPSMEYKLVEKFRGCEKIQLNDKPLDFGTILVDHIIEPNDKNNSYLYDIEVENTHNFIANDVLVHNCISWEKVKRAVDCGFADRNPNDLENFVGDFVFNPAEGTAEIPIYEPVEVLEGGTGFMMIQRHVFEKFRESYPHLSYLPDHVRTEHFDGTREIFAFFDALIDDKNSNIYPELTEFLVRNQTASAAEILKFVEQKKKGLVQSYSNRYLSEDYMFCQWVRRIGMKVWFCPWMKLSHMGSYMFAGSLADLAKVGAAPTADVNTLRKTKKKS